MTDPKSSPPAFANGGVYTGAWGMVGECGGPIVPMPPARVFNAGEITRVLEELRQLREHQPPALVEKPETA